MRTASQIVHGLDGAKTHPECDALPAFRCWICAGEAARGMLRVDWLGVTFVGQNKVRYPASDHVCEACVVVMSGKPPDTERMYSHLVEGLERMRLNKGNKPAMREFLRRAHASEWFAAIADSGQKHVIPWTPVNPPGSSGGRVMFEEALVVLPSADSGWSLIDDLTVLLTCGATKEEVSRGTYGSGSYQRCASAIFDFEMRRRDERGSPWFDLAVWLAQRDETAVAIRMADEKESNAARKEFSKRHATKKREMAHAGRSGKRKAAYPDGGDAARNTVGVSSNVGSEHPETLGSDPGPNASGVENNVDPRGMVDVGVPDAPPRLTQLTLF
jgi:hypothetical protein